MSGATGPFSREEFDALVKAPFGAAIKAIRKHDPLWGLKPGETIAWRVKADREVTEIGTATVRAASEEEAKALADKLTSAEFDWEAEEYSAPFAVTEVEPA